MSGEDLRFPDESFDLVFCHGVLHHSPVPEQIVAEVRRVLKMGGKVLAMVYHRDSINYHLSIRIIKRLGIVLLAVPVIRRWISQTTGEPEIRLHRHLSNLKDEGLKYLRMENFIHKATDGPDNVYSAVYTVDEARSLFSEFTQVQTTCHYLNERQFPVLSTVLPRSLKTWLGSKFGWHLWIKATK
jgi:SAM-dependent methyltransferase